ncbi:hypothetical protein KJ359_009877 [Pestalotiopsis sp. 9143b]|nr:hypothetical protein KJ359_009877 [Pestalotiopsis sp. 9143b]
MALSTWLLLQAGLVLGVGTIIYKILYNLFISPLKQFPGPLLYSASSIPYDIACANGYANKVLVALHDKYGPVVRIRPTELSYIEGHIWKDAWGFRSGHAEWAKGESLHYPNGSTGILGANKEDHRRIRRGLAHAFSNQGLRDQSPRILRYADQLIEALGRHARSGPVDMVKWFSWTTTDVIGDLAFGETFGALRDERQHEWMSLSFRLLRPAVFFGLLERWGVKPLAAILLPREVLRGLAENSRYIADKVGKRLEYGKDRGDFFDRLLKSDLLADDEKGFRHTEDGPEGFTLGELESTAQDLVFAGSETTATLLAGAVYFLLQNPRILAKVAAEVRGAFSQESDMTVASTEPAALPYMDAVLSESIRIYDPVPLFAPRVAPKGGDTVGGVWLPEGTRVCMAKYVSNRSPRNFARPTEYVPERWLPRGQGRPAEFDNDNASGAWQPFSHGARNCVGMNLAKAEMHLILAKLLFRFDLCLPAMTDKEKWEWDNWVERQSQWFLWIKPPLMVDLKERH